MNKISITFNIDKEKRTFEKEFKVTEKSIREAVKISLKLQTEDVFIMLKNIGHYMVSLFDEQFTYDEFIDSNELEDIFNISEEVFLKVTDIINKHNEITKQVNVQQEGKSLH